jgi:hypothetical protein
VRARQAIVFGREAGHGGGCASPLRQLGNRGKMRTKRRKWLIATGPGDFLPLLIGCALLVLAVPPFVTVLSGLDDQDTGVLGMPVMTILAGGIVIGLGFLILGIQLLSTPGSLVYRLAHGRLFRR